MKVLDPTNEMKTAGLMLAPRLASLEGLTVGIITNAKEGTKGYFTHLDRLLRDEMGAADVVWREKSNYSAPAEPPLLRDSARWHALVSGIGD